VKQVVFLFWCWFWEVRVEIELKKCLSRSQQNSQREIFALIDGIDIQWFYWLIVTFTNMSVIQLSLEKINFSVMFPLKTNSRSSQLCFVNIQKKIFFLVWLMNFHLWPRCIRKWNKNKPTESHICSYFYRGYRQMSCERLNKRLISISRINEHPTAFENFLSKKNIFFFFSFAFLSIIKNSLACALNVYY
jgi:hypothetical protein